MAVKAKKKQKIKTSLPQLPEKFKKLEATGNDFILLEISLQKPFSEGLPHLIQSLCKSKTGIGADGLILLDRKSKPPLWRFFNADGSETGVCGNAARCVARTLKSSGLVKWKGVLGNFSAILPKGNPSEVSVNWTSLGFDQADRPLPQDLVDALLGLNDSGLAGFNLLNVGVPHLVLLGHEIWSPEIRMGSSETLRRFSSLGPEGANVTWISLKNLSATTFERGVEGETLSCGSGALAGYLALNAYYKNLEGSEFKEKDFVLHFPGGDLKVSRDSDSKLWLTGQTRFVYEGKRIGL